MLRAVLPEMRAAGGGTIVNLSSVHGFAAVPNHAHYEASKGGINMFTKACAIELAPHNIQVNAIGPGYFHTELNTTLYEDAAFNTWVCERTRPCSRRWPGEPAAAQDGAAAPGRAS